MLLWEEMVGEALVVSPTNFQDLISSEGNTIRNQELSSIIERVRQGVSEFEENIYQCDSMRATQDLRHLHALLQELGIWVMFSLDEDRCL